MKRSGRRRSMRREVLPCRLSEVLVVAVRSFGEVSDRDLSALGIDSGTTRVASLARTRCTKKSPNSSCRSEPLGRGHEEAGNGAAREAPRAVGRGEGSNHPFCTFRL